MIQLLITTLACAAMQGSTPTVGLQPVPFRNVQIEDHFWTPRQEINRTASVDHCLKMLEQAGNLHNFELAAAGAHTGYEGYVFNDSDVYKVLEGASDTLALHPDSDLERRLDRIIDLIGRAQMRDGYVDTYYEVNEPTKRFTNLRDNHELYCAGHMFEAASAHFWATGKTNFLNIAKKYADLIYSKFGPESGHLGYGGHPELELALVKLSKATGDRRYFALAEKLIKTRGSHYFATEHNTPPEEYDGTYWLDDVPIDQHNDIKGHAVRAAYLMSGAADVVSEDPDSPIEHMLDRVWRSAVERRIFVTGGIGPSGSNEGFTVDYDLPNLTAYQETCASIAMAMWGERMGLLHADAHYYDAVENALYNAMLAGVSQDGKKFFYVNPLASTGNHHRAPWFGCACCPPNALRTIAAIGGYAYAQKGSDLYVNLYIPGSVEADLDGKKTKIVVSGNYPWDGRLTVKPEVTAASHLGLHLRIPGWCSGAKLKINGVAVASPAVENGYFVVDRTWNKGDSASVELPMPVERLEANPNVKEDQGKLAVRRGPLIYCMEQVDQTAPLDQLVVPETSKLKAEWKPELLGGVDVIEGVGEQVPEEEWRRKLYQAATTPEPSPVKLVPYCDWDNRKPGPMEVWLPITPPPAKVGGLEIHAKVTVSYLSGNAQPEGINDGTDPKSSGEQPARLMHWWPHKGGTEWVAYSWKAPVSIRGIKVYWFDDTGRGECRLPTSWHLERREGDKWIPVEAKAFPIAMDKWCEVNFAPIKTEALRLVVQLKDGWAAGVRQWRIVEADSE